MPAAPAKPAHRGKVPWDPWCWLEVQVATATGGTAVPENVGYWQPEPAETSDPRYTTWVDDSVTRPPEGTPPPAGYGEWVEGGSQKYDADWDNIAWSGVDCDLQAAAFSTGSDPWDWNASPGNGTLSLIDNEHIYFPLGDVHGPFDDITVNTPIRVVAHLTDDFNSGASRQPSRVLITGLIRRITHTMTVDGRATTSINFSEPHVLYGRVNRDAAPVPKQYMEERFAEIAAMSDDPQTTLLLAPESTFGARHVDGNPAYPPAGVVWNAYPLAAGTVSSDLWSEVCKAANSFGLALAIRLYPSWPDGTLGDGTPRVYAMPPIPQPPDVYNVDQYGGDTRIVSPTCSPPETTGEPYTYQDHPDRVKIRNSPVESIDLGHDDAKLANVVSVAAAGGSAAVSTDLVSMDRWYRHTYQRHDLVFDPTVAGLAGIVGWRVLERLSTAVFDISDCTYLMNEPRDFEFALGAVPASSAGPDLPPVEPGRWMKLGWSFASADLRVTHIEHDITPQRWTVTHSYEVHNPITIPLED